jgi:hypothetical protein
MRVALARGRDIADAKAKALALAAQVTVKLD